MASVTHDVVHEAAAEKARVAQPVHEPLPRRDRPRPRAARRLRARGPRARRLRRLQLRDRLARLARGPRLRAPNEFLVRATSRRARTRSRPGSSSRWWASSSGALLSGLLAGRVGVGRSRRARASRSATRLAFAFVGGALMAIGAAFARGCTSGQALTGGALLNLGSWAFMMCVFGGAYAVAWFFRRQWR